MPDATPQFKQQLREAFESLQVGQMFSYRRTFTEGDVSLFIGVTGDLNPYHQVKCSRAKVGSSGAIFQDY
jgi:acyl dehydratase